MCVPVGVLAFPLESPVAAKGHLNQTEEQSTGSKKREAAVGIGC